MLYARLRRTLLATTLGLMMVTGLARGGDKPAPVTSVPGVITEEVSESADEAQPKHKHLAKLRPSAIKERWQNHTPLGCYSHFNDYTCGNFHSEVQFLFGSCRGFYGEACLKGPPPSPVPGFDPEALGLNRRGGIGSGGGRGDGFGGYGGYGAGYSGRCPSCR